MRFIVYGAGAVGGSLGGLLAAAGYPVVLVARGEHLRVIQSAGLIVHTPQKELRLNLPAVSGPAEIDWQPADVVLLTMKGQDTESAVRALPPGLPVVCVQNGVANERIALRHFADVYGVCVMFPAAHLTPGATEVHSAPVPGILNLGRYPDGVDDRAAEIATALRAAGFVSELLPDIMRWKYTKLLMNLGNAVQAVSGDAPQIGALVRAEGVAVLTAAGVDFASDEENRRLRGDRINVAGDRSGSSSWQSLTRRTGSIEADYLNGEIVLLGRLHGITTPYNEHARRMANLFASSRLAPGSLPPEEWLSGLDL